MDPLPPVNHSPLSVPSLPAALRDERHILPPAQTLERRSTPRRESLPFVVRTVTDDASLLKAISMRAAAYGRHVPDFARQLELPEPADKLSTSTVLIAESKLDRLALGTMRIQTNLAGPLALEQSFELPEFLRGCRLAEATRLGVVQEKQGRLIRTLLFKAFFHYCVQQRIDWMVITARSPLDRIYESLQFTDIRPGAGFVPMAHVGGLPHRVLGLQVSSVEPGWKANAHPLYEFFFATNHPDLRL